LRFYFPIKQEEAPETGGNIGGISMVSYETAHLFEGWQETLIYSCLQEVMGKLKRD
jgi:hypothetical protein